MIVMTGEKVEFGFDSEEVIKSIAILSDLRDFCLEQIKQDEVKVETAEALQTAIEVMEAFWCEKFGEEESKGENESN